MPIIRNNLSALDKFSLMHKRQIHNFNQTNCFECREKQICWISVEYMKSVIRMQVYPSKTVVRRCSTKKLSLKISQYLLENTCVGVSFN